MCGRARCTLQRERVAQEAGVPSDQFVNGDKYNPVENMGPGRYTPVMYQTAKKSGDGGDDESSSYKKEPQMRLEAMRWGLIPSFTKPNVKPDHFIMFNARSDTLQERPAFRRLVETRRCVVMCDGYYEWQQVNKKEKQPYYFYRTSGVMKFAGLYDTWTNNDGEEMHSFTILTTDIAPHLRWLHTRMPVILTDEGVARWVSDAKFAKVKDLLVPYTADDLKWHPVDKRLGSTKFQSEDCAKKVDIKHAGDIKSFFGVKAEKKEATTADDTPASHTTNAKDNASSSSKEKPKSEPLFKHEQAQIESLTKSTKQTSDAFFSPKRQQQQTQESASPMKGFVPASSILGKRSSAASSTSDSKTMTTSTASPLRAAFEWSYSSSPSHQQQQQQQQQHSSAPSKKLKTATTTKSPKKGTLHAFFQSAK